MISAPTLISLMSVYDLGQVAQVKHTPAMKCKSGIKTIPYIVGAGLPV